MLQLAKVNDISVVPRLQTVGNVPNGFPATVFLDLVFAADGDPLATESTNLTNNLGNLTQRSGPHAYSGGMFGLVGPPWCLVVMMLIGGG